MPPFPSRLGLAAIAVLSSTAHAFCPPPTEAQCYDNPERPGSWFQTTCGQAELARMRTNPASACNAKISARIATSRPAGVDGVAPVPAALQPDHSMWDTNRDYIAPATIATYDPSAYPVTAHGLASRYIGSLERFSAAISGGLLGSNPFTQRMMWDWNGSVASCDEYVYERYFDYSVYESNAAHLGIDYRAMFEDGYPRLADGVQSRSGSLTAMVPVPAGNQPKNAFFAYRQDYPELPAPMDPVETYAFVDTDLVDRMKRGSAVYNHTLEWHGRMSEALTATYGDSLMYALAQKQRDFVRLLAKRAALYKRWLDFAGAWHAAAASCAVHQSIEDSIVHRWDQIWDPAGRITGWDLQASYVRDAYTGIAQPAPSEISDRVSPSEGVFASPALDFGVSVLQTQHALELAPNDPLAIQHYHVLSSREPDELVGGADDGVTAVDPTNICDQFLAPDALPTVSRTAVTCDNTAVFTGCARPMAVIVAERLQAVDHAIEQAMTDVSGYGCLALDATVDAGNPFEDGTDGVIPSPCDWNPELFVQEMANHFTAERERDYGTCKAATGGSFGATTAPIRHATDLIGGGEPIVTAARAEKLGAISYDPGLTDYTSSSELVTLFIRFAQDWAMGVEFQRDANGNPVHGHSASDSDDVGSALFGVTYGYDAGWGFEGLPTDPNAWSNDLSCSLSLRAHGRTWAHGTIFGVEVPLFDVDASVSSAPGENQRTGTTNLTIDVLGVDIAGGDRGEHSDTADGDGAAVFHVIHEKSDEKTLASQVFVIAGVPVMVRAGVAGSIGFAFDASVDIAHGCDGGLDTSVTGTITPSASLGAFVSGGVTLAVAEVGVQLDLTLIEVKLPFALDLHLMPAADGAPMIHAAPTLKLALSTLAGKFRAYARFPFLSPIYVTLFAWDGVQLAETVLFAPRWDYPLARVAFGLQLAEAP